MKLTIGVILLIIVRILDSLVKKYGKQYNVKALSIIALILFVVSGYLILISIF